MTQPNEHTVKVLNSLIETTLDSVHGYQEAAENAAEPQLKSLFAKRASDRLELSQKLQAEVRTFGGEPETDQSILGKAHNKFVDLKAALTRHDTKAVINEVERGEDFIKGKFEHAMRDDDLAPGARTLLTEAYSAIKSDHDEISRMKHQLN